MRQYDVDWLLSLVMQAIGGFVVTLLLEMAAEKLSFLTGSVIPSVAIRAVLVAAAIPLSRVCSQHGWMIEVILGVAFSAWVVWYVKGLHLSMGIPLML
jgi:hypothetical protein